MKRSAELDPFLILGIPTTANGRDIKTAYHKRLRETHPDNGGKAEWFHQVVLAYKTVQQNPNASKSRPDTTQTKSKEYYPFFPTHQLQNLTADTEKNGLPVQVLQVLPSGRWLVRFDPEGTNKQEEVHVKPENLRSFYDLFCESKAKCKSQVNYDNE